MKKLTICLMVLTTAFLISCHSEKKETVLLRLRLEKGQTFDVISEMKNEGNDLGMKMQDKIRAILKVDSVLTDSTYILSSKTDYILSKVTGPGQNEYFSSNMSEESMTADQKEMMTEFRPVLDSTLTLQVNNRGTVTRSFAFRNGIEISKDAPPFDFSNFQLIYPEKPVAIGEVWENEKINSLTSAKTSIDCRITSIKENTIEIATDGSIEIIRGMSNHLKGKYIVDRKTMKTLKAIIETESKYAGKITVTVTSN